MKLQAAISLATSVALICPSRGSRIEQTEHGRDQHGQLQRTQPRRLLRRRHKP